MRHGDPAEHGDDQATEEDADEEYADQGYTGPGLSWSFLLGIVLSVMASLWWCGVGMGTENFGSDCTYCFGEIGPKLKPCLEAGDTAEKWLPRLVTACWGGTAFTFLIPDVLPMVRRLTAACVIACMVCAVIVGQHALSLARP